MGILSTVVPMPAVVAPNSALQAAQAAAQRVAAAATGAAPPAQATAAASGSSSLHQEENVTISGSTQRFLIMQKLARSEEVGWGARAARHGTARHGTAWPHTCSCASPLCA